MINWPPHTKVRVRDDSTVLEGQLAGQEGRLTGLASTSHNVARRETQSLEVRFSSPVAIQVGERTIELTRLTLPESEFEMA